MMAVPIASFRDSWGGSFESGVIANMFSCILRWYKRVPGGYESIYSFHPIDQTMAIKRDVSVVFSGSHFKALLVDADETAAASSGPQALLFLLASDFIWRVQIIMRCFFYY